MTVYDNRRTYLPVLSKECGKPVYVSCRSWVHWREGERIVVGRVLQSATKDNGRRYLDVLYLCDEMDALSTMLVDVYDVVSIEPPNFQAIAFLMYQFGDAGMTPRRLAALMQAHIV